MKKQSCFFLFIDWKANIGQKIVLEGQIQTDLILLNVDTFFQQNPEVNPEKIILGR